VSIDIVVTVMKKIKIVSCFHLQQIQKCIIFFTINKNNNKDKKNIPLPIEKCECIIQVFRPPSKSRPLEKKNIPNKIKIRILNFLFIFSIY
jgi:hypothetical protein